MNAQNTLPVPAENAAFSVSEAKATRTVSPLLFGTNLEHTRASITGGISAELLRNRKFAGKPGCPRGNALGWDAIGEDCYLTFTEAYTRHAEPAYRMHRQLETNTQRVQNFLAGSPAGISQDKLSLRKDTTYLFAAVVKASQKIPVTVSLCDRDGTVLSKAEFCADDGDWCRAEVSLSPARDTEDGTLRVTFSTLGFVEFGALSLMPEDNFRGMRRDVIAALKDAGVKLLRWPGGNFAGEYCWMDGLLPRDKRTPSGSYLVLETQPFTMGYDQSELDTDDFLALCEEIGAEPYVTINTTWCTPEENAAWVEYCNGGADTEWGKKRAERGHPAPYGVKYWTLGNEAGYGHMEGDGTPCGYARVAKANAEAMRKVDPSLLFCVSGPYPNEEWAEKSLPLLADVASFVSLHYYASCPDYSEPNLPQHCETCLADVPACRENLAKTRKQAGNVAVSFDEWNVWYAWYRPSCLYDGIFAALMLHAVITDAKQSNIGIACQFEAVNEGLIAVTPNGAALAAEGQIYGLMSRHAGGNLLSASLSLVATEKEGIITVTYVNPSFIDAHEVRLSGTVLSAELYESERILPASRFTVSPLFGKQDKDSTVFTVPPHSVLAVTMKK